MVKAKAPQEKGECSEEEDHKKEGTGGGGGRHRDKTWGGAGVEGGRGARRGGLGEELRPKMSRQQRFFSLVFFVLTPKSIGVLMCRAACWRALGIMWWFGCRRR